MTTTTDTDTNNDAAATTNTTIKTIYHAYNFDISKPEDLAQWTALKARLTEQGLTCFETWGGKNKHYQPSLDGRELALETKCLFANQWNTAPVADYWNGAQGLRVFDWAMDYQQYAKNYKRGYYLDQTAEMQEVRRNTHKCGYCGKQEPAAKGYVFCPHCIDSEYLDEQTLPLTRMIAVEDTDKREIRADLTQAEREYLLPLYREAQLHGKTERGKERLIKQRQDIEQKAEKRIRSAKAERDGMTWLLDHGVKIDNVIYYDHTGKFSFGWRKPVSQDVKSGLLDILVEFPFEYEIKGGNQS